MYMLYYLEGKSKTLTSYLPFSRFHSPLPKYKYTLFLRRLGDIFQKAFRALISIITRTSLEGFPNDTLCILIPAPQGGSTQQVGHNVKQFCPPILHIQFFSVSNSHIDQCIQSLSPSPPALCGRWGQRGGAYMALIHLQGENEFQKCTKCMPV